MQVTKFALGFDYAKDYVFDMARKKVMKQTSGLYPAPLRILEVRKRVFLGVHNGDK